MKKQDKLKYCSGCESSFYNGNNPYGIQECWHLKDAKIVMRKKIHVDQIPPYDHIKPQKVLSCYRQKRYVFWE